MRARYYQVDAVNSVFARYEAGDTGTLIDMATGTGKTFVLAMICRYTAGRCLILAHRDEIIRQTVKKLREVCPNDQIEIEGAGERMSFGHSAARLVVASKDTLCQPRRLYRFGRDEFDLVIVDEGHHAVKKNATYWRILKRLLAPPIGEGTARLLLVTATSERADGEALGALVQSMAYHYPISKGIADNYLVQPKSHRVHVTHLETKLDWSRNPDGEMDITPSEMARIARQEEYLHQVVGPAVDVATKDGVRKSTLIFMPNKESARRARDMINGRYGQGDRAVCILGGDLDSRREQLDGFQTGRYQYIVTCDVLTEGWDSPQVQVLVPKPTGAWSKFVQMVGRGLRPWEGCSDWPDAEMRGISIAASPKPVLTVLDPSGVTNNQRLLNVVDIFRGVYSPEVLTIARDRMRTGDLDVAAAIAEAHEEARRLEEARRAVIVTKMEYGLSPVDLFTHFDVKKSWCPKPLYGREATDAQVRYLEGKGVRVAPGLSFWDAKTIIDAVVKKDKEGPATDGQKKVLARYNLDVNVTRGEASALIDKIKANGWQWNGEAQ